MSRRPIFFPVCLLAAVTIGAAGIVAPRAGASDPVLIELLVEPRGSAADLGQPVPITPVDAAGGDGGLWLVDQAGRIATAGDAASLGDLAGVPLQRPVVAIAAATAGDGYWLAASDGGVFAFGSARFQGSMGGVALNAPVVGIAATPSGEGYWLVAADGGVFAFGDAPFLGSMGGVPLNRPVVGIVPTATGDGYWLVAADGGVFAFGDAPFLGADVTGSVDIVDLAPSPGGGGYWVALADGAVRSAGAAPVHDGDVPAGEVTAIVAADGGGYWLVGTGDRLPESGSSVFDGRMLVAHYGSPLSPALGLLGETGPEAAIDRIVARAADYEALGVPAVPTMEIITTIATSFPGADGDYSAPTDIAVLRPWIDLARANDVYVLLDLQPGRSDFLSQARLYEELLREPHVGLAIDPEWRMGPNQRPGQVIGSVGAAEVNAVTAWLDELTVSNGLPEKLFVIHQFTAAMVQDRPAIIDRPNLATTFHIDGFGTQAQKIAKFDQLHPVQPFDYGIKLFIDEDTRMFTPTEVLALDPRPDLVTHQ